MNCIHQLKTLRRISHASATSHALATSYVLATSHVSATSHISATFNISAISHISTKLTFMLNPLARHDNDLFFMLNLFVKHNIILFNSVRVTNTENDKVRVNSLFTFKSSENIQLWILEVNDYFNLHRITDLNTQATVACFYLKETLHYWMQRLQLAEEIKPFLMWEKLQSWLLMNYSLLDAGLKADLIMNRLLMRSKEMIQFFINCFKIIITDLD